MGFNIAINGFGRIGRLVLRAVFENNIDDIKIVGINDLSNAETLAHLLKFDSVHGRFPFGVDIKENNLVIDGKTIPVFAQKDPALLPWNDLGVDIVMECTGIFRSKELSSGHIRAGAKRVLISAPAKDDAKMVVYGVNENVLDKDDIIVSNASCTTNALAPILQILDNGFKVEAGIMTTIHAYTISQPILDKVGKDLYRGRAGALSIIPTTTGAAKAIGKVLPEMDGIISGVALRVPVPNVSVVDLTVNIKKSASVEAVNSLFKQAAQGKYDKILGYVEDKMVSCDFVHNAHSSVFVPDQTYVQMDGHLLRVYAWYDNEWGFANRMLDTAKVMVSAQS